MFKADLDHLVVPCDDIITDNGVLMDQTGRNGGIVFNNVSTVKAVGIFHKVPRGIYWPSFKIRWDSTAQNLENIIFGGLIMESNILDTEMKSEFVLGTHYRAKSSPDWISLKGPPITVHDESQVMMFINDDNCMLPKSGLCIHSFSLLRKQEDLQQEQMMARSERPMCNICHKSFSRMPDLVRHMQTHSRNITYTCESCGGQFSRKDALLRHMRTSQTCSDE